MAELVVGEMKSRRACLEETGDADASKYVGRVYRVLNNKAVVVTGGNNVLLSSVGDGEEPTIADSLTAISCSRR